MFVLYLSFVQFLQYYYQRGCLYRLRALGERHNMDVTAEGFQVIFIPTKEIMLTIVCVRPNWAGPDKIPGALCCINVNKKLAQQPLCPPKS